MIEYRKKQGSLTCVVKTNLIASNIPDIREDLLARIDQDDKWKELVLDLSDTDVIDSIGVNLVVNLYKKIDSANKSFKTIGCNKSIMEVLKLFRLDQHFKIQMIGT